jgi:hypothetical protein
VQPVGLREAASLLSEIELGCAGRTGGSPLPSRDFHIGDSLPRTKSSSESRRGNGISLVDSFTEVFDCGDASIHTSLAVIRQSSVY